MIKILLLAVVPFITQHRNVAPKTEVSTNFYGSVTGIVDKAYIEARVGAGGGGCDTNAVDALANSAVVTNALTVATTNRVALLESSKADKSALKTVADTAEAAYDVANNMTSEIVAHTENKSNPHSVTAAQIGAVPFVEDASGDKTAVTIGSRSPYGGVGTSSLANGVGVNATGIGAHAEGFQTSAYGNYSHAEGANAKTYASYSHAGGFSSRTLADHDFAFAWNGDETMSGYYISHGAGTFNINPVGGLNGFYIGEQTLFAILTNKADKADISSTNPTFSNAVLAVGLNIDTNSVAVLNDIAETFGGFPLGAGETATTVGGLLAALAAAAAWLKKNKVQTLKLNDNSVETSADGGVAKLDDFFTESNSLLMAAIEDKVNTMFDDGETTNYPRTTTEG